MVGLYGASGFPPSQRLRTDLNHSPTYTLPLPLAATPTTTSKSTPATTPTFVLPSLNSSCTRNSCRRRGCHWSLTDSPSLSLHLTSLSQSGLSFSENCTFTICPPSSCWHSLAHLLLSKPHLASVPRKQNNLLRSRGRGRLNPPSRPSSRRSTQHGLARSCPGIIWLGIAGSAPDPILTTSARKKTLPGFFASQPSLSAIKPPHHHARPAAHCHPTQNIQDSKPSTFPPVTSGLPRTCPVLPCLARPNFWLSAASHHHHQRRRPHHRLDKGDHPAPATLIYTLLLGTPSCLAFPLARCSKQHSIPSLFPPSIPQFHHHHPPSPSTLPTPLPLQSSPSSAAAALSRV